VDADELFSNLYLYTIFISHSLTMSTTVTQVRTGSIPKSLKTSQIRVEEQEITELDIADIPLPPPSKEPTEVLSLDKTTPDSHVPRDPRLIRLTGIHPFNVEPPLTTLFQEGTLY
jgi:nitrate reductase (NAD(P)H)